MKDKSYGKDCNGCITGDCNICNTYINYFGSSIKKEKRVPRKRIGKK